MSMSGHVKVPPLAFPGYRLRNPGGPRGGQYHGYLGDVYRAPGETNPSANASGNLNTVGVRHPSYRTNDSLVPGYFTSLGIARETRVDDTPAVTDAAIQTTGTGATSTVALPAPVPLTRPNRVEQPPIGPAPIQPSPTVTVDPSNFLPYQGQPIDATQPQYQVEVGSDGQYHVVLTSGSTSWFQQDSLGLGYSNLAYALAAAAALLVFSGSGSKRR